MPIEYPRFIRACTIVFVLVLTAAITGCSKPTLPPLSGSAIILAFGDSLTEGKGVDLENAYPAVLSKLTGRTVINEGISGEVSADGLSRLPDVLDQHNPDLLILLHGGNDILRNHSFDQLRTNLRSMIELARSRAIPVVLIGVPEKNLFSDSAALYESLAEEYELVFDDDLIAGLLRSPSMKSDSVHFNKAGYRKMASDIHQLLSAAGAL